MTSYLQVEPVSPDQRESGTVFLDPHAMAHAGLDANDVVEIRTKTDRTAVARVGDPREEDHDTGFVRLNDSLRKTLKVAIGDTVEVAETDIAEFSSVTFAPLSDVSSLSAEELAEYLRETYHKSGRPVNRNGIEYVSLPGAEDATGFKVVEAEPESGVVGEETDVTVEFVYDTWGEISEPSFEDIGGLEQELREIRELVEFPIRFPDVYQRVGINPPRGVILYGPPGTGKTMTVRAIATELDADFHYINGPGIISTGYGQTEEKLRSMFGEARQNLPSIVFIDELDAIAPKREETGTLADMRVVAQLMELMDGLGKTEGVMVVATTNRINSVEPALRRPGRFDREVYVGPPDPADREDILSIHTRGMLLDDQVSDFLPELSEDIHGYTGADIKELTREAGVNALRRQFGDEWHHADREQVDVSDLVVSVEDFEQAIKTVQPSVLRSLTGGPSNVRWDDIAGLEGEKRRLQELIEVPRENPETFEEMALETYPGILLSGPSGTGKSLLAQAAGNEMSSTFIQIESAEVFSQWVGKSEETLEQIFRNARRAAPSIVLVDNIEVISSERTEEGGSDVANRVLNQLLSEMEKLRSIDDVTVIGTTNRQDIIDDALLSPNRFGEVIEVGLPEEPDRRDILFFYLEDVPADVSEDAVDSIATRTEGWSGAELEALVRNAKFAALRSTEYEDVRPISGEDLEQALEETSR